jgi:lysophospholipase L1-like esterase
MLLILLACAPATVVNTEPVSSFGQTQLEIHVSDLLVQAVHVDGVMAYDVVQDGQIVTATLQGGPTPGWVDVVLTTDQGEVILDDALEYLPPADPLFDRVTAIGASLTMGVQDGVPTLDGQLWSPGAQLSRAAGAYYPMPLLVPELFGKLEPEHVGPAPGCHIPGIASHITQSSLDVLDKLKDEDGQFDYSQGRIDPDLVPQDVGVGGFRVGELTESSGTDLVLGFLAHLALDPHSGLTDEIYESQVDLAAAHDPTLVLSFDTFGNDLIAAVVVGGEPDLGNITEPEVFQADVDALMDALAPLDAQIFLANSPRPGLLPAAAAHVRNSDDPEATLAVIDQADAICVEYNQVLADAAAAYDHIHIVDAYTLANELNDQGVVIDGQALDVRRFGGLLSLDGVHFTDVGYALMAQLFLDTIEAELGVHVDPIDLEAALAQDDRSPTALLDAGIDRTGCDL